jgi:DNA modification methylase
MPREPYYADGTATLYLGDCREVREWLTADVIVTDPPYGTDSGSGYASGFARGAAPIRRRAKLNPGATKTQAIAGDADTSIRDDALALTDAPAIIFGSPLLPAPRGAAQWLAYIKPPDSGAASARGGWRRDVEAIYLCGAWPVGAPVRSSALRTMARAVGSPSGVGARAGHPHAKPLDIMEALIDACPPGVIADPFAGSGSTLVAARNLGRQVIGVEIEERYCEIAARRLAQGCLDFGETA